MAFSFFSVGSEQELCDISSSSYKDTLLLDYTSMLMMSFNLNWPLKSISQNIVTLRIRVSAYPF